VAKFITPCSARGERSGERCTIPVVANAVSNGSGEISFSIQCLLPVLFCTNCKTTRISLGLHVSSNLFHFTHSESPITRHTAHGTHPPRTTANQKTVVNNTVRRETKAGEVGHRRRDNKSSCRSDSLASFHCPYGRIILHVLYILWHDHRIYSCS
jgi:hypothetical protein